MSITDRLLYYFTLPHSITLPLNYSPPFSPSNFTTTTTIITIIKCIYIYNRKFFIIFGVRKFDNSHQQFDNSLPKFDNNSSLISGPTQPGNDIDVYLAPLVEDLRKMWDEGVSVFDAYANEMFTLRAMLLCTINDFPAYGNLFGYKNKGKKACPICIDDMEPTRIPKCKDVYMNHQKFLPHNHPYCRKKKTFNGEVEKGIARHPLTGYEVYEQTKGFETIFGKPSHEYIGLWKKESIFWKLSYWKDLEVSHCLDVMHIEKNVCDALLGTLFNIPKKTKDVKAVRDYFKDKGIRPELWPQVKETKKRKTPEEGGDENKSTRKEKGKTKGKKKGIEIKGKGEQKLEKSYLPPACYTLSKEEKRLFCESLYNIKVPSGYSSNMKRFVTLNGELKLGSMKSHDCHVMMQVFIPIAIRGILPRHVRFTITELCAFFHTICNKVLDPAKLDSLQADIIETLCKFEMYFPPTFFDIMVHLVVHLVREIKLLGPIFLRWCYPFKRHMGVLQNKVRNPAQPEASIVQGIVSDEVGNFIAEYLEFAHLIGLPKSRHEGRLEGKGMIGSKQVTPPRHRRLQAHLYVLHHVPEVHPFIDEHVEELKSKYPDKGDRALMQLHNKTFVDWFYNRVIRDNLEGVSETVKWLAFDPRDVVNSHEGYDVNGYTFWTEGQDQKSSSLQNSGVSVRVVSTCFASAKDSSPVDAKLLHYGRIQEIWELDYSTFTIGLFLCTWVDNNKRCVNMDDPCGFTLVDLGRLRDVEEPFILARQAKQVFYITDPADKKWSIVIPGKRSILGIGDVDDEEKYDAFEDSPPFINPKSTVVDNETGYMREDHSEGILVETYVMLLVSMKS